MAASCSTYGTDIDTYKLHLRHLLLCCSKTNAAYHDDMFLCAVLFLVPAVEIKEAKKYGRVYSNLALWETGCMDA